jgi:hypothetical protein
MIDPEIDKYGTQRWYNSNKSLHRENGPAVIHADGTQQWYVNGKWHRTDGPAMIYPDGAQLWYINGDLHRKDGPAYISASGYKEWYVSDIQYFDNKSFQQAAKLTDEDMLMIKIKYGDVK